MSRIVAAVAVALLLLACGVVVGYWWAWRRAVARMVRLTAGFAAAAQRAACEGARARVIALASPPAPTQPQPIPGESVTAPWLDLDTPLDALPDDYGADVTPVPGCCVDCDEALNIRSGVAR